MQESALSIAPQTPSPNLPQANPSIFNNGGSHGEESHWALTLAGLPHGAPPTAKHSNIQLTTTPPPPDRWSPKRLWGPPALSLAHVQLPGAWPLTAWSAAGIKRFRPGDTARSEAGGASVTASLTFLCKMVYDGVKGASVLLRIRELKLGSGPR